MHGGPRQLRREQHKHKDTLPFFILISVSQHGDHPNSGFVHSLTQITAHKYPSVFNSAWSKHTICFCFIPIIFTTRILDKVQVQLHSWRLSVVPPGCCWGTRWSPGPFLTVMEEPLRRPGWGRKPRSVARWGEGAGRDIQELKTTMAPLHTSATQNTCPVYLEEEEMRGWSLALRETTIASNRETMRD